VASARGGFFLFARAILARCSQRNVPAAASATSWRFSEVFDRSAAIPAAGDDGLALAEVGPKRCSQVANGVRLRFVRRSRSGLFSPKRTHAGGILRLRGLAARILARNVLDRLARQGIAIPACSSGARSVLLGSFAWQVV